jgi:hypothetical protein
LVSDERLKFLGRLDVITGPGNDPKKKEEGGETHGSLAFAFGE